MYKIASIPGDGIGPEVTTAAFRVVDALAGRYGFKYEKVEFPWCTQYYLDTGKLQDHSNLPDYNGYDAIYLGAIGDPRAPVGLVEKATILTLRFGLDLYINLRPIRLYAEHLCPLKGKTPEDIDIMVVRENTEGAYSQIGGHLRTGTPQEISVTSIINTRFAAERACRYAFELARKRGKKKKVTLVDKANAIPTDAVWQRAFAEVGSEYKDIETEHAYVDAACMWMVKNPEWFDVIVTSNLFGDIITDLGAQLVGGLGIAASGNLHPGKISLFEPIHGSAPKYAGKNVANPLAAILAAGMMLDYLGESDAWTTLETAVAGLLAREEIKDLSAKSGLSTTDVTDIVIKAL
ncbi:MAG: 3-isopropylmalate dehydrogenase [Planctomycetes bacterium]|nr:3-isopropylmalate dehydrogenase [Planctomycetota bacterium]